MEKWAGSLAVVTGASVGIGAAIAEKLVLAGVNVVGIGRRLQLLEELEEKISTEETKFYPVKCDLTDQQQILDTFQWIENTLGGISILVNNAGLLLRTTLISGVTDFWKSVIDVNVISVCICTREVIKSMKKHEIDGIIINISSITAHRVIDMITDELLINMYPAAKFALNSVCQSLLNELRQEKSKIRITKISPGIVVSELYRDFLESDTSKLASVYPMLQSEDVANALLFVLSTPLNIHVEEVILRPLGECV